MKHLILVLLLGALCVPTFGQKSYNVNQFYRKYSHEKGVMNFKLPGWLMRFGGSIGRQAMENKEDRDALKKFMKKMKGMKMMVIEDENPIPQEAVKSLLNGVKTKSNFEDLIQVRSQGTYVNMMIQERGSKIRNLLMLVSEEDTFVLMSLKMKMKLEDLVEFINQMTEENANFEIFDLEEEEEIPLPQV